MSKSNIVLVYDITSIPDIGVGELSDFNIVHQIYTERNVLLWDSWKDGVEPKLLQIGEGPIPEVKLLDVKELTQEEIKQLITKKDE